MLTEFGKQLRIVRIKRHMTDEELAKRLDVTPSFLAAVERGEKTPPESWPEKLWKTCLIDEKELEDMQRAIFLSTRTLDLQLIGCTTSQRELAYVIQSRLADLDDVKCQEMILMMMEDSSTEA